eukprot:1159629-Pelagomonas_calceolata.AAC.5
MQRSDLCNYWQQGRKQHTGHGFQESGTALWQHHRQRQTGQQMIVSTAESSTMSVHVRTMGSHAGSTQASKWWRNHRE